MSLPPKRAYNRHHRQAQAAHTRERILNCAKELFLRDGFEEVTIEKIAQGALVSTPTIYALFQSKRGLLLALLDETLPSEAFSRLVEAGQREKSPRKRLQITAKLARQLYEAESELHDLFQGAALLAPALKAVQREREERRYMRQEAFVQGLMADGALKEGLSISEARDLLWTLTGRDLYRLLVMERGWSIEAYEQRLAQLLMEVLLKESSS